MKSISTSLASHLQVLFVVGAAASSASVLAAPSKYWLEGPCGKDVKEHCGNANAGEVMKCLRAHEKNWTLSCREKFAEKRGHADSSGATSEKKE